MASNINLIVILMLAFYASNGSLLLIRQGQGCLPGHEDDHAERDHYRQSRVSKRSVDPEEEDEMAGSVGWIGNPVGGDPVPVGFRRRLRNDPVRHRVPWRKRNQPEVHAGGGTEHHPPKTPSELLTQRLTSQFVFRSPRGHRQYDVPQIGEYHSSRFVVRHHRRHRPYEEDFPDRKSPPPPIN
ncbi:UNVERIFIED_CONTAM: hypothetical protein PYX00_004005 [Menopon gallinae]|uniref:Uncharacterized protein n=1 Tax=Menopon gallinae TaxID=328185 RepID=A0AAW2I2M0_9NEOP